MIQLTVTKGALAGSCFEFQAAERITIGRNKDNTCCIQEAVVSDYHAEIRIINDEFVLIDLGSSNGTFINRSPVKRQALHSGDEVAFGSVVCSFSNSDEKGQGTQILSAINFDEIEAKTKLRGLNRPFLNKEYSLDNKELIKIGRLPENDIVLEEPTVSSYHAEIKRLGTDWKLIDYGSVNGSYHNNQRVTSPVTLHNGDRIKIDQFLFEVVMNQESIHHTMIRPSAVSGQPPQDHKPVTPDPHNAHTIKREARSYDEPKAVQAEPSKNTSDAKETMHAQYHTPSSKTSLEIVKGGKANRPIHLDDNKQIIKLGRHESCDIILKSDKVSSQHCLLRKLGQSYQIEDLGSTNGLLLNGKKIQKALLKNGDLIAIGPVELKYVSASLSADDSNDDKTKTRIR